MSDNNKLVRVQRGAVHLLAFMMFFGAFVLAAKAGIVAHLLGILMALAVLGCLVVRLIVRENDPKSLIAVLYVKFFEVPQSVRDLGQAADISGSHSTSARCARCCAPRTCTIPPTSR